MKQERYKFEKLTILVQTAKNNPLIIQERRWEKETGRQDA